MSRSFAQSFKVSIPSTDPAILGDISGVHFTSVGLFFNKLHLDKGLGVRVSLCAADSQGVPIVNKIIPNSSKHLDANYVYSSTDASGETKFTFDDLVYLEAGLKYAIIIDYDGDDPDFYIWTAKKNAGVVDTLTGEDLSKLTYDGVFYQSNDNGTTWSSINGEYLKVNYYRAKYSEQSGTVHFIPSSTDRFKIDNFLYANSSVRVDSSQYAFLATNTNINSVNSQFYGQVDYFNYSGQLLYIKKTSSNFSKAKVAINPIVQIHSFPVPNTIPNLINQISANTLVGTANITQVLQFAYNYVIPHFATLTPPGTEINLGFEGMSNNFVVDSSFIPVLQDKTHQFFDYTRYLYSNSVPGLTANPMIYNVTLKAPTDWISPVVDNVRSQTGIATHLVDPTISWFYSEFFDHGKAQARYISQPVTLAPGQDAQDINVYISAHRPLGTDIQVFVKFLNGSDQESLKNKSWTPLINTGNTFFSSFDNNNLGEYLFNMSSNNTIDYNTPRYVNVGFSNGTVSVSSGNATVTGTNTSFSNYNTGYNLLIGNDRRRITSIASNTSLTLNSTISVTNAAANYYLTSPSTTAYYSNNGLIIQGGTIAVTSTGTAITGTSTNFINGNLKVNSNIIVNVGAGSGSTISDPTFGYGWERKRIVSIASATSIVVDSPFTTSNTAATMYLVSDPGIIYQNNDGSIYSGYISFQVKVVLYADDRSKVPYLKNIRAIALQI